MPLADRLPATLQLLVREIASWFQDHALTMDALLAEFLHENGHGPRGPDDSAATGGR